MVFSWWWNRRAATYWPAGRLHGQNMSKMYQKLWTHFGHALVTFQHSFTSWWHVQNVPKVLVTFRSLFGHFCASCPKVVQNVPKPIWSLGIFWSSVKYLDTFWHRLVIFLGTCWVWSHFGYGLVAFWTHFVHILVFCDQNVTIHTLFTSPQTRTNITMNDSLWRLR